MSVVTLLYGFVGFFGYLKYGDKSKDSITLSLPQGELYVNEHKQNLLLSRLRCAITIDNSQIFTFNSILYIMSLLSQVARNNKRLIYFCHLYIICASMLCTDIDNLGELFQRWHQEISEEWQLFIGIKNCDYNIYVLSCCCCSSSWIIHIIIWCILSQHFRIGISSYHGEFWLNSHSGLIFNQMSNFSGNLCLVSRQIWSNELAFVERLGFSDICICRIN